MGPVRRLLVYYGWPSAISQDMRETAVTLAHWDDIILGAGLENPGHPDHRNTRRLIRILHTTTSCHVYGYTDLGVTTSNPTLRQVRRSLARWARAGAAGVLLDDFGNDYQVSPRRRRQATQAAHRHGLQAIANAWNPNDVDTRVDYALLESWQPGPRDQQFTRQAEQHGFHLISLTQDSTLRAHAEQAGHTSHGSQHDYLRKPEPPTLT